MKPQWKRFQLLIPLLIAVGAFHIASLKPLFVYADNVVPGTNCGYTDPSCYFPPTGFALSGAFWAHWRDHGGLAQNGYPISEFYREPDTGKGSYTAQYFERAVFEYHPENAGSPFEVLLGTWGRDALASDGFPTTKKLLLVTSVAPGEAFFYKGTAWVYRGGQGAAAEFTTTMGQVHTQPCGNPQWAVVPSTEGCTGITPFFWVKPGGGNQLQLQSATTEAVFSFPAPP